MDGAAAKQVRRVCVDRLHTGTRSARLHLQRRGTRADWRLGARDRGDRDENASRGAEARRRICHAYADRFTDDGRNRVFRPILTKH